MTVVGFDFGTTNSLISLIVGDAAFNFLDPKGLPIPSVVCYEGAKKIVGRSAKERLGEAGLGIKGNVVRSPKLLLGKESVFIEGVEHSPVDIVADVVQYVCKHAISESGHRELSSIDRAVVTIPVNMRGVQRAALRDAFRKAGVAIVQFIHEPLAALYGYFRTDGEYASLIRKYNRKLLLVFDWGGGTLDLTLCRLVGGMLVQLRNDGTEEVGGDEFDSAIMNEVTRKASRLRGLDEDTQIHPDATTRLLHNAESVKIVLSSREQANLYVPNFFRGVDDEDLDYDLTREELEKITKPLVDKGLARISKLLESADVSPAEIGLCLASGGMANMPTIKARLHELFGPQRVQVSSRSATLIAEGAAWAAHDEVGLHLAKKVELVLARNSYMTLIESGTKMPKEGEVCKEEFHLYCVDPRDGFAKFQLQAPLRPGAGVMTNEPRTCLENIVVAVDKLAQPFRERLELDVSIDDNLVLHAQARSLNKKALGTAEVHDLEFGLSLPDAPSQPSDKQTKSVAAIHHPHVPGELAIRSNIADKRNELLVPGELIGKYNPHYLDRRNAAPQIQLDENLYYKPCATCGRDSNDPLCKCDRKGEVNLLSPRGNGNATRNARPRIG